MLASAQPYDPRSGSPLLTVPEAAQYLRVSPSTLNAWRTARRGRYGPPFVKIGRRVVYREHDLEQFLEGHTKLHTGG
jgi:excisionase family DNA binding protein